MATADSSPSKTPGHVFKQAVGVLRLFIGLCLVCSVQTLLDAQDSDNGLPD